MPIDAYDMDDDEKESGTSGASSRFKDFDCPSCNANNPIEFGDGDELLCNYCGTEYRVKVTDDGRAKLKEL